MSKKHATPIYGTRSTGGPMYPPLRPQKDPEPPQRPPLWLFVAYGVVLAFVVAALVPLLTESWMTPGWSSATSIILTTLAIRYSIERARKAGYGS